MTEHRKYEQFPLWMVIISNVVTIFSYLLGFMILLQLHLFIAIAYLIYILFLEYRLISQHCIHCYYWGKVCGFGKGKISAILFRKGDVARFCNIEVTWVSMIPDLLVSLIPVLVGIVMLVMQFDLKLMLAVILLVLLATIGNGIIRGEITCKYCKQRELGCPAEKLFQKNK